MTNTPENSDRPDDPDDPSEPDRPLRFKRGAFPTPKSELDAAEPYIPDGCVEGTEEGEPEPPPKTDDDKEERPDDQGNPDRR